MHYILIDILLCCRVLSKQTKCIVMKRKIATPGDAGIYTCMVGNIMGLKSVNVWLKVRSATTISSSTTENTTTAQKPPSNTNTTEHPTTRDTQIPFSFSTDKDPNSSRQSLLNTKAENVQLQKKTVDIVEELLSIQKQKLKLLQKSLTS
ncbi:uncharacterized protein LOC134236619 [Saccostrea cucullata]|uniref:uncharacterized protein LOC134236619 n=1 Tax=Saccostrea cuccullata TaxID=36930 RepID=UPI002ED225CC